MSVQIVGSPKAFLEALLKMVPASHSVIVSETEPPNPEDGDLWYKPSEDRYRVYVIP